MRRIMCPEVFFFLNETDSGFIRHGKAKHNHEESR